ncbi:MAG: alpha/beta fold hydrolase, partial [Candidatus Omnitrophica bacterium]|nr:alpha/beta fold hydrolase [Candidatus Omnitrophota bacterium]
MVRIYHYIINLDGYDIGGIRIDKFVTGDKLIYRSVSSIPFYPVLTDSKSKIVLDKGYNLESYSKDNFGKGVNQRVYMENTENSISFVATFQSEFALLNNIPIRKGTFIFEEDAPITYLPIIENYDFRRGRAQGFNAISHFATFLPPMKRYVTLTSVRDEYLKVDSRKIKTECLLLKIKNYPQGMVWVSKSDRSLIAVEMPNRLLKIRRTFLPKGASAALEHQIQEEGYVTKDVNFKNKNIKLAGTLTVPKKDGKFPLVLLIWGSGAQDRRYQGLFTDIADYLSKSGYCVFSFDKRGVGSSEGDFSGTTDGDEMEDLNAALEFLATQIQVDPKNTIIIGHSKGAFYASLVASKKDTVRGIILMAPSGPIEIDAENLKAMASQLKWSEDYLKLTMKSNLETMNRVKAAKNNWASILGKRAYLKRMKEELDEKPMDVIKEVKVP